MKELQVKSHGRLSKEIGKRKNSGKNIVQRTAGGPSTGLRAVEDRLESYW
jgi:hypothetical protein